jgi:hypothetical protein
MIFVFVLFKFILLANFDTTSKWRGNSLNGLNLIIIMVFDLDKTAMLMEMVGGIWPTIEEKLMEES